MAGYKTGGLKCVTNSAGVSEWSLFTEDALATAIGSGYVTDAGPAASGKGAPGRGHDRRQLSPRSSSQL